MNTNLDHRPGLTLFKKLKEKHDQAMTCLANLDEYITKYTEWDEIRTNEVFQKFTKGNEDYSKIIDSLNKEEKEIIRIYHDLIYKERLLEVNIKSVELKKRLYKNMKEEIPKDIEKLSIIAKTEIDYLERMTNDETMKSENLMKMKDYFNKVVLMYKSISQISLERVDSKGVSVVIGGISVKDSSFQLRIYLEISNEDVVIKGWSPKEFHLEKFFYLIEKESFDLNRFLCEVILEGIKYYNV